MKKIFFAVLILGIILISACVKETLNDGRTQIQQTNEMAPLPHFDIEATVISLSGQNVALIKIDKINKEVIDTPNVGEPQSDEVFDLPDRNRDNSRDVSEYPEQIAEDPHSGVEAPDINYIHIKKGKDLPSHYGGPYAVKEGPSLVENPNYIPEIGDTILVVFYYGTSPAIIRTVPLADVGDSNIDQGASSNDVGSTAPDEIPKKQEGDYLVTTIESSAVDEIQEEILPGLEEGSRFKAELKDYSDIFEIVTYELIS